MRIRSFVKFEAGYNGSPNTRVGKVQVLDDDGQVLVEHAVWKEEDCFVYEKPWTAGTFTVPASGFGVHEAPEVTEEQAAALLRLAEAVEAASPTTGLEVRSNDRHLVWWAFENPKMLPIVEEAQRAVLAAFN
jgi:hypothetical protein